MEDDKEQILRDSQDDMPPGGMSAFFTTYIQPCLAELVGTMIFVFIGTMSVTATNGPTTVPAASAVVVPLAHGLTIALLVASFGTISGGLFNPAVNLGLCLAGHLRPIMAVLYTISQLVGGIVGAAITRGCMTSDAYKAFSGAHTLGTGITPGMGILCETALTFILVMTILMTACDTRTKNIQAPLAIGFAITVDIIAGFFISGGSMNPARSLGPAVVVTDLNSDIWKHHYVYWLGPALGAFLAAIDYRLVYGHTDKRLIFKQD